MKKLPKKTGLEVKVHTIRVLADRQLGQVAGGATTTDCLTTTLTGITTKVR